MSAKLYVSIVLGALIVAHATAAGPAAPPPEGVIATMEAALAAGNWPVYFSVFDPKVTKRFCDEFLSLAKDEERRQKSSQLLKNNGLDTVAALEGKGPAELTAIIWAAYLRVSPDVLESARRYKDTIVGTIVESEDLVHVSMRSEPNPGSPQPEVWVQTLQRTPSGWVALESQGLWRFLGYVSSEIGKAEAIRADGPLPPDFNYYDAARHAYSCGSVEPPSKVRGAEPVAMESCTDGVQIKLGIVIDEHGKVAALHLDYAIDPKLGAAAIDAVRRWRYEPARKDGKAVSCHLSLLFRAERPEAGTESTSSEESVTSTKPQPNALKPAPVESAEDLPGLARTAEEAVRAMLAAYDERDWPAYFSVFDPKVIRRFRDEYLSVARQEEQRDGVSHLLKENGEGKVAALEGKSPSEAVGRILESYIHAKPGGWEVAKQMRTEILGTVEEGPDTVNVSMRTTSSLGGEVTQVWVQPVRRTEAGWVLMQSNDPRELLGFLRNELARAQLTGDGILSRPAETSFEALARGVPSCESDPPVKISGSPVNFPSGRKRKPGSARVLAIIDENGNVAAIRLESKSGPAFEETSGPALEDAIVAAIHTWRFKPGRRNNEPVSCFYTVTIGFSVH